MIKSESVRGIASVDGGREGSTMFSPRTGKNMAAEESDPGTQFSGGLGADEVHQQWPPATGPLPDLFGGAGAPLDGGQSSQNEGGGSASKEGRGGEASGLFGNRTIEERFAEAFTGKGMGFNPGQSAFLAGMMSKYASGLRQNLQQEYEAKAQAEKAEKLAKKQAKKAKKSGTGPDPELTPKGLEKHLRAKARQVEKRKREDEDRRDKAREKQPKLFLNEYGVPEPKSWSLFRTGVKAVINNVFTLSEQWGKMKEDRKNQIREQLRDKFKNGASLAPDFVNKKLSKAMSDKRNNERMPLRAYLDQNCNEAEAIIAAGRPDHILEDTWTYLVEEELQLRAYYEQKEYESSIGHYEKLETLTACQVIEMNSWKKWKEEAAALGDPPKKLIDAKARVASRPKVTHRMGQGGAWRLQSAFVSRLKLAVSPRP